MDAQNNDALDGIAIIGMACRFPMAKNVQEFWDNLVQGRDCIGTVSLDDARKAGVPEDVLNNPRYIRRGGRISNPEMFDAQFFGFSPKDAAIIDPQQRLFLQCGWEAIESAGYDVSVIKFPVAVFGGSNLNFYLLNNVINNPGVLKNYFELQTLFSSDKDYLATRLSYKFNLTGPSMTVQTACSTSLVATHLACQSLLTYQCDMALAGGVSLQIPWWNGYVIGDADIRSPDGVCRPFDAKANGTLFGEGCGIVVLKRLQDALQDNDHIYAVIRGSAINNDGSLKAGYTAPGVDGQTDVITSALDIASVNASDVTYVETHGTGTPLGDPVEITALTKAYRHYTNANGFCGIGSVKASIGHLDAAAGIAGLIKTVLALYHKKLPQTVNFSQPNPLLELEKTPFYVVSALKEWIVPENSRRIAGVSSLGVGGTNAHIIVEEPPRVQAQPSKAKYFMFSVSARSQGSLKKIAKVFTSYLPATADAVMDIAYTLQYGRQNFPYRQFVVADSAQNAIEQFTRISEKDSFPKVSLNESERIVFMFSGQGSQYVNMSKDLYNDVPVFKTTFDYCCEQFKKHTNKDLRDILFTDNESNSVLLQQTDITQPALFTIEYSLVKYWETLGIKPAAMIGHSIGEYIAACISGVFSLDDTIAII
ncbi:MAG TPA: type I polyketide synthase, partial [Chitinispirillaceae bacterium]|nr:type I polyketide synthase [Chitinispirillaceae bacterium]